MSNISKLRYYKLITSWASQLPTDLYDFARVVQRYDDSVNCTRRTDKRTTSEQISVVEQVLMIGHLPDHLRHWNPRQIQQLRWRPLMDQTTRDLQYKERDTWKRILYWDFNISAINWRTVLLLLLSGLARRIRNYGSKMESSHEHEQC